MTTQTASTVEKSAAEKARKVTIENRGGIAVIKMDDPESKVNALSQAMSEELFAVFEEFWSDSAYKAAVLISGKPDFIVGADINMLNACRSSTEVERLSRDLQAALNKVEDSAKPVVAAINGNCLGGGLEVALACHYRLASDSPKTSLGLPEVMLGLLPGGGGTQRLPRLVGIQKALDMMLTGKNIRAKKAKKMGLVDDVVIHWGLEDIAIEAARRLAAGELSHKDREPTAQDKALEETAPGRLVLFRQARAMVKEKTGGLYPAPLAIIDCVEHGMSRGMNEGLEYESKRFGELGMTPEAKSLMSLFFGQTALKKNRFGKPDVDVSTLGVLGAGLMGSGIALVSVQKGMRVHLKDVSNAGVARGKKQIFSELDKRTKRKAMTPFERDQTMARVIGQTDYKGFEHCDVVIEAVFEDIKLKHKVIEELEQHVHENCIVASNTSALPIGEIAKASKRPENVVGMHYFSPVQKMPLLEVITTDQTSKRAAALAVDVGLKQGKTVIVVKDGPGFYTTRILIPYMDEAVLLALEGIDWHDFDDIMKAFGFPVGPVVLMDEVGIDVGAHVAKDTQAFFEPRFGERVASGKAYEALVNAGFLGRKTNKGFYLYDQKEGADPVESLKAFVKKAAGNPVGKHKPVNPGALEIFRAHGQKGGKFDRLEVQQRMAMRFINEAVLCLQEGILSSPVDGDIGAVFGLGFPPFHGGPFRYVDTTGAGQVVSIMERLADKYGKRFAPCELLVEHAKKGTKFHTA